MIFCSSLVPPLFFLLLYFTHFNNIMTTHLLELKWYRIPLRPWSSRVYSDVCTTRHFEVALNIFMCNQHVPIANWQLSIKYYFLYKRKYSSIFGSLWWGNYCNVVDQRVFSRQDIPVFNFTHWVWIPCRWPMIAVSCNVMFP